MSCIFPTGSTVRKPSRQPTGPARLGMAGLLLGAFACLAGCSQGDRSAPAFERIAPDGLADSQRLWNYSQVITANPGARLIEVAGTTGDDKDGNIVDPDSFEAQVERTFQNVETSLRAAGASGEDVIRVRMYVVDFDADTHWPIVNTQMRDLFGEQGPTATLIGVQSLATPDILFEMDATAASASSAPPGS